MLAFTACTQKEVEILLSPLGARLQQGQLLGAGDLLADAAFRMSSWGEGKAGRSCAPGLPGSKFGDLEGARLDAHQRN